MFRCQNLRLKIMLYFQWALRHCLISWIFILGNIELGVTSIPRNMFSILSSLSWWDTLTSPFIICFPFSINVLLLCYRMLPSMKTKVLCALILTVAALSQNNLLYHAIHDEVFRCFIIMNLVVHYIYLQMYSFPC